MTNNKLVLFEIPIYKSTEKEHNDKWNKTLSKSAILYRNTEEDQKKYVLDMLRFKYPSNVWEYNQIIGYIKIYIRHNDVHLGLYLCNKKRFAFNSCKKEFIEDVTPSGSHFFIHSNFSNQDIIENMNNHLHLLIKYEIKKNWYVDLKVYNLLHKEIDYIKIIRKHKN